MAKRLFLDMDGTYFDFEVAAEAVLGAHPSRVDDETMWVALSLRPGFFRTLPLMPGALIMWQAFKPYSPAFLSAVPKMRERHLRAADADKRDAVALNFGAHVPVITCHARYKYLLCRPGDVLLDDYPKYGDKWQEQGGVFVHHNPHDIERSMQLVHAAMQA